MTIFLRYIIPNIFSSPAGTGGGLRMDKNKKPEKKAETKKK